VHYKNRTTPAHKCAVALLCFALPASVIAAPWIDSGDVTLRHHLLILADAGIVTVPINTWPLMWSGIRRNLENADRFDLNAAQATSLAYVQFAATRETRDDLRLGWKTSARETKPVFSDFADHQREQVESQLYADWIGGTLAGRAAVTWSVDPLDDKQIRYDGSYIAGVLGNWALSVGAIDRWWGPGWQQSNILSTNARPIPGVAIQRNYSDAFETKWLNWLGPWQLVSFMGQMESAQTIEKPLLWGMRITLRPLQSLELGLSRTAQWGGKGRPHNLGTFGDLLVGKDNNGSDGIDSDNEPGNQLAGVDLRWSVGWNTALYGQFTGEDEAGFAPSRFIATLGADVAILGRESQTRIFIEASDTTADGLDGLDGSGRKNYAYEHGIYADGYRFRGRAIGAATDNDSRLVTLGADHHWDDRLQISWSVSRAKLNQDGSNVAAPGGNVITSEAVDLWIADARVSYLVNSWQLTAGVDYSSEELQLGGETAGDTGVYVGWEWRL